MNTKAWYVRFFCKISLSLRLILSMLTKLLAPTWHFQRSLKSLANYLHTTYSAEVAEAVLKMQAVSIKVDDQPPIKTDPTTKLPAPLASWEEYKWRQEYTEQ